MREPKIQLMERERERDSGHGSEDSILSKCQFAPYWPMNLTKS